MKKILLFGLIFLFACSAHEAIVTPMDVVTSTPTHYLSPTSTIVVTPTLSGNYDDMISTVSAAQTKAAQFPSICDNYSPVNYSPNGLWLEELCYSEDDHDLVLTLANRETKVLWKLLYHDYIPELDFFPNGAMAVVHWSNDGRYAYFNSMLGGSGYQCFVSGWDIGSGLFRIDLQTGQTTAILSPNNNFWSYGFSFSPTDRRLVYGVNSRDYKILDLVTGLEKNLNQVRDFDEGGGYLWSSDGLEFVYATILSINNGEREEATVRLVNAQTGSERILLESENNCYRIREWQGNGMLIVENFSDPKIITYDLNSNTVIDVTAIPHP